MKLKIDLKLKFDNATLKKLKLKMLLCKIEIDLNRIWWCSFKKLKLKMQLCRIEIESRFEIEFDDAALKNWNWN